MIKTPNKFIAVFTLLVAFVAANGQQNQFDNFAAQAAQVTEFDVNGLKVILKRRVNSPTVAGGLFIRGGARNITDKTAGIESLTLASAIEASKTMSRQAIRRELASTGSSIGSSVSSDYSVVSLISTKQHFDAVWNIFTDAIINPAFAAEDIERDRNQILTGLREQNTFPEVSLEALKERVIYAGHPYANDASGTIDTISKFTAIDLKAHHQRIMETSRLLLVIVGDIDAEQLKAKLASSFGKLPRGTYKDVAYPALDFSKGTLELSQRTLPTNYVQGVFAAPPPGDADYYAMRVTMAILQSLVFEAVRTERQLSYAPDAGMSDLAANSGYISVSTNDPNTAVSVMLDQIKLLQTRVLNDAFINGMSGFFLTKHYIDKETSVAQAADLALYELNGGGWQKSFEFLNGVRRVTGKDVQRVANKYIKNLRFAYLGNTASATRSVFLPN